MIKEGVVRLGSTPSVLSGKPSVKLAAGEPLAEGEELNKRDESVEEVVDV